MRYIVLDTNVFGPRLDLTSASLSLVRHLGTRFNYTLALPEVVFVEAMTHFREDLQKAVRQLEKDLRPISSMLDRLIKAPVIDVRQELQRKSQQLKSEFEILPLTPEVARESLLREAQHAEPTKAIGKEEVWVGGRDATIWATVRDLEHQNHEVILLSNDKKAFGDEGLKPMLRQELHLAKRVRYVHDASELLAEFGEPDSAGDLEALIDSDAVLELVINEVLSYNPVELELLSQVPGLGTVGPRDFGATPVELVKRAPDYKAFKLDEARFLIARTRWATEITALRRLEDGGVVWGEQHHKLPVELELTLLIEHDGKGQVQRVEPIAGTPLMLSNQASVLTRIMPGRESAMIAAEKRLIPPINIVTPTETYRYPEDETDSTGSSS